MISILRYFTVGGIAASVDIGIFVIFAKLLGLPYAAVATVGFLLATAVNYRLSIRWVFESGKRFSQQTEIMLVFAISAIGLALTQLILYMGIEILGLEMLLCKLFATAAVFAWNYTARARIVFRPI